MDPHELERHLRYECVSLVDEVTRWQPARWQEAIRWLRWLPYLPALQKLARGGRPPAWTRADPVLRDNVALEPALRGLPHGELTRLSNAQIDHHLHADEAHA